jgi:hypothetical protein
MLSGSRVGFRFASKLGVDDVQTTQPRDVAALVLVVGLFLVLFIVTVMLGSPTP